MQFVVISHPDKDDVWQFNMPNTGLPPIYRVSAGRGRQERVGLLRYLPRPLVTQLEWILGMWANCLNVVSPVSLGLFECENKSKYFQKSLPQLCM